MQDEQPLVNQEYLLEKFPGKGGWTYIVIPEIQPDKKAHFGWVKVKGRIDEYELNAYRLMPMGNGRLFLPVKAEIRRKIGKKEGDWVKVILFSDATPLEIPQELIECFANEPPKVLTTFLGFTEGEQKAYLDWIYGAKREDTKAERIANMMERLMQHKKFAQ